LRNGVGKLTIITKDRGSYVQETEFDLERFGRFMDEVVDDSSKAFDKEVIEDLKVRVVDDIQYRDSIEASKLFDLIIKYSNDLISKDNPDYTHLSASALRRKIYKEASKNRGFDYKKGYGDYYSFVIQMVEQGLYDPVLTESYTEKELRKIGNLIDKSKDKLFSYAGLFLMKETYMIKGYKYEILELPQERFLTAALYLLKDEKKTKRYELIKEAYWALSNHLFGLATPTLKSAGAPHGSLSSCHEIVWNDDLYNIYDVQQQTARFSQNGAGIGLYAGFLRGNGSWIRGIKGRSSGVGHPSRSMSVLAEYVNQLGKPSCRVKIQSIA
jgi:ribonucleoside-diphosphate reductase alpha chain